MNTLRHVDQDLWVADAPMAFLGLSVGTRMSVIRLPDQRLFLHSPVSPSPPLIEQVAALGTVSYLIAPNKFHHMFIEPWQQAFPEARTFAAPGLGRKRPQLRIDEALAFESPAAWRAELDQVCVGGIPMLSEVVFFHRASRSLLLTDLAFNFRRDAPPLTRLVIGLVGKLDYRAPTLLERLATKDRPALRESLQQILALPFQRIIVTHGEILETGGREQLQESYAWALRSRR